MADDRGTIITVDGPMTPDDAGITLPHEHLFADWRYRFELPEDPTAREIATAPIQLEHLWYIKQHPQSNKHNLGPFSVDEVVDEVARFADAGGGTIVDVTPKNVGSRPDLLAEVADRTGVRLVCGTGFYELETHPERLRGASVDDVTREFVSDVENGIDDTGVRAGVIGEIGTSIDSATGDIHAQEKTVLRASARAALRTGATVSIHTPLKKDPEYPPSRRAIDILDLLEAEGLPPDRVILGHLDQSKWMEPDLSNHQTLADRGAYVEFDLFGGTKSGEYIGTQDDAKPSDANRAELVEALVESGHEDRILVSHDIYLRYQLTRYGGYGYSHLLANVLPMFRARGLSESTIGTILKENPGRALAFSKPRG